MVHTSIWTSLWTPFNRGVGNTRVGFRIVVCTLGDSIVDLMTLEGVAGIMQPLLAIKRAWRGVLILTWEKPPGRMHRTRVVGEFTIVWPTATLSGEYITIFDTFCGTTCLWRFLCCTLFANRLLIKLLELPGVVWVCIFVVFFEGEAGTWVGETHFWPFDALWGRFGGGDVAPGRGGAESWALRIGLWLSFWPGLAEVDAAGTVTHIELIFNAYL